MIRLLLLLPSQLAGSAFAATIDWSSTRTNWILQKPGEFRARPDPGLFILGLFFRERERRSLTKEGGWVGVGRGERNRGVTFHPDPGLVLVLLLLLLLSAATVVRVAATRLPVLQGGFAVPRQSLGRRRSADGSANFSIYPLVQRTRAKER